MNYEVDEQPMLALRRARRAWERSQPQLIIPEFWGNEDGLSEGVKRAATPASMTLSAGVTSPVAAAAPSLNPRHRRHIRDQLGRNW